MTLPTAPRFGRTDPATSADAAELHRRSGRLGKDQWLAMRLVREHPGCTAPELGRFAGPGEQWRQRVGRRLSELLDHGLVYRQGTRDGCACWWPVTASTEAQGTLFDEPEPPFRIGD